MNIPHYVPSVPIRRNIPGLRQLPSRTPLMIGEAGYNPVPEGTILGLDPDTIVIVGRQIGEGRQGRVYELATCPGACLKLPKNDRATRQFRREILGYLQYLSLNVPCPELLGADGEGKWILKARWPAELRSGTKLLEENERAVPPHCIHHLMDYARRFEEKGFCVDGLPSNILFLAHGCGSYETTLWPSPPKGTWTFAGCFLLMWLPDFIPQNSADGWPPFRLSPGLLDELRASWESSPLYAPWREAFGDFPDLCKEWWEV